VTTIGEPGLIASADPSPDGKFLLVTTLKAPFSRAASLATWEVNFW
jgi:hypothetical protein